ncbi:MFS transporter [Thalassoroseus pseudoceratinae]|uniref:MFS transporter n=1 Tax=Thalassoroseus pseudoceratinae TaxID=2713176 RepID=UPI001421E729|nr:MFS transporter [Thalassoroseus pseudoceratinae]
MAETTSPENPQQPTHIRHLVVFVAMLMAVLLYLDRFCVGFAVDYIREDLRLTQTQISWFISAFFWSYALAQVPSGWLSDRYGARIMLAIYVLSWSVFTAMIGAVYSFAMLLFARVGCGLGQAGAYPTSASVVSKWVPFPNRGLASAIVAFGGRAGGALAPLLTASLIVFFLPADATTTLQPDDMLDRQGFLTEAQQAFETSDSPSPKTHLASILFTTESDASHPKWNTDEELLTELNRLITDSDLYDAEAFRSSSLPREAIALIRDRSERDLTDAECQRLNRFLLEESFPDSIGKLYAPGWRPVMMLYGSLGIFVAGLVWLVFRSRPEKHPWCNAAEAEMIENSRPVNAPSPHGKPGRVPLVRLLTSRSMWLVCLMQFGTNVGWLFLVAWLPRYLLEVHSVPILQRGFLASVPLMFGIAGVLFGGRLTDFLTARAGLKWGRRWPLLITRSTAAVGYAIVLWLSTLPPDSPLQTVWMYVAAFSLVSFSTDSGTGSVWAFNQDVGGRYVGSVLGWSNMWGNLGAAVSPLIYNYYLGENPTGGDWNQMFLVCLGAFVIAGLCALGVDATRTIAPPDDDKT